MEKLSNKMTYNCSQQILGSYLAGLWEGDGHITIGRSGGKPSFHITFHIKESPVAIKLLNYINRIEKCDHRMGSIRYQKQKSACTFNCYSIEGLKSIIHLVNGKLRTPKAYQIHLIIDWLNKKHNTNIQKLPSSSLAFSDDAWLAGFIDADGSFGVECLFVSNSKNSNKSCKSCKWKKPVCKFRLVQRMDYPISVPKGTHLGHRQANYPLMASYKPIMSSIADYLGVKLNLRKQTKSHRSYFIVSMSSTQSKKILRAYLDKYFLLTSKRFDYMDWCAVDDIIFAKQHYTEEGQQKIRKLKNSMNKSRTYYSWDHLEML